MNLHDFDITEEAKKQGRIEGIEIGVQQKAEVYTQTEFLLN